jgi:translation initiation factor 2B subunit (eIF-2B alpha/beta/delta family)
LEFEKMVRDRAEIGRETYTKGAAKSVTANTLGPSHIKFTEALHDLYTSRVKEKPTYAPNGNFCRLIAAVVQYRDGVESPPKSFRRWAQTVIDRAKKAGRY